MIPQAESALVTRYEESLQPGLGLGEAKTPDVQEEHQVFEENQVLGELDIPVGVGGFLTAAQFMPLRGSHLQLGSYQNDGFHKSPRTPQSGSK